MSANQYLLEAQVRHQVYLLRRGAGMANEIIPIVERALEQAVGRIANTPDQRARQLVMVSELQSILSAAYAEVTEQTIQSALELAEYEADYQVGLMGQVSTVAYAAPAIEQIAAVALNDPLDITPGSAMTIRQALEQYGTAKSTQIIQTITDGIIQQMTNAQIAAQVRDLAPLHRRQADALVRTIASGVSSAAKRQTYQENAQFLKGERYLATLDSRTTQICMGLDSRLFAVGEGPYPPQHYNCRSVRVPEVRDDLQLSGFVGERPENGADGKGVTSSRTTMNSWLERQPEYFQRDFFAKYPQGEEKYRLFKEGGLNAQKFVDASGSALTMDELRARYPDAAQAAGLA